MSIKQRLTPLLTLVALAFLAPQIASADLVPSDFLGADLDQTNYCYALTSKDGERAWDFCSKLPDGDRKNYCYGLTSRDGNVAWGFCQKLNDPEKRRLCYAVTSLNGNTAWANCKELSQSTDRAYCYAVTSRDGNVAWKYCDQISDPTTKTYCYAVTSKKPDTGLSYCKQIQIQELQHYCSARVENDENRAWNQCSSIVSSSRNTQAWSNQALVIIDMQNYFVTRGRDETKPENQKKLEAVLAAQIEAIKGAVATNTPILFIEYDKLGPTYPKLKAAAEGAKDITYISKTTDGMLDAKNSYRQRILSYLRDKKIGTLIIAGANGGACVLSSIQGILNENVNVLAYSQAIADFNFHSFAYPYEYKNQRLTYHCPTCRFRETNSINDVFPLLRIVHPNQVDRLISEMSSPRGDCKK